MKKFIFKTAKEYLKNTSLEKLIWTCRYVSYTTHYGRWRHVEKGLCDRTCPMLRFGSFPIKESISNGRCWITDILQTSAVISGKDSVTGVEWFTASMWWNWGLMVEMWIHNNWATTAKFWLESAVLQVILKHWSFAGNKGKLQGKPKFIPIYSDKKESLQRIDCFFWEITPQFPGCFLGTLHLNQPHSALMLML